MQRSYLNEYFDVVFVINLAKRTDRKLAMLQKLSRLGVHAEFVEATYGYEAPFYAQYKAYEEAPLGGDDAHEYELRYSKKMIRSAGAWGYLDTWARIMERSIEKNYERILCLDDDVIFHKDFEEQFAKGVRNIRHDWKLLYLGASQHSWNFTGALFYPDKSIKTYTESSSYYHPSVTDGSFAVGVHRTVFPIILEEINRRNCALDSGPLRRVMKVFPERCFVLTPNLIIADVTESDIGISRDQTAHAEKMKWDLSHYDLGFTGDLVSVILPTFNAEQTLEKAVQSILLQSYKNLELIIVDDCSTDHTARIAEEMASKDSRVRFIRNEVNKGCYFTRNRGIRASAGKAIAIQDSDDVSLEQRLEKQLVPIFTGEAEFSLGRIYRSRCEMSELDISDQPAMLKLVESRRKLDSIGRYEYRDRANLGFVTSVFNRKTFEELGLFWEERFAADMEFLERILFNRAGKVFNAPLGNAHQYLSECGPIPGVYKRLDEVVLVCSDMKKTNITNSYKKKQLDAFKSNWRGTFIGNYYYKYPELEKGNAPSNAARHPLFTFFDKGKSFEPENGQGSPGVNFSSRERRKLEQKIRSLEDEKRWLELDNKALVQSYSWKLTKPIRVIGEFFMRNNS